MAEDRSLDEFAGDTDADTDEEEIGEAEIGEEETDEGETDETETNPTATVTATATWTTGGADCDRCGESVTRRWRDGDALVCADCKDWSG